MFHEREHSLHHSHEMTEKVGCGGGGDGGSGLGDITLCCSFQEILDSSSNGIPQMSYNGHTAETP